MKSYLKKLMSCLIACVFIFWGTSCKDDGPAAALDNGEFYTIEMYLPVQSATTPLDMDVVEEELNKILKEKINAEVKFTVFNMNEYAGKTSTAISANTKIDLIFTNFERLFFYLDMDALYPMDELFKAGYGDAVWNDLASIGEDGKRLWEQVRYSDGHIYAAPNIQILPRTAGFTMTDMELFDRWLKETDTEESALASLNLEGVFDTVEAYMQWLKDNKLGNGGQTYGVEIPYFMETFLTYDDLCMGMGVPGVVDVSAEGSPVVINQFKSEKFKYMLQRLNTWYGSENGHKNYIPAGDAVMDSRNCDIMSARTWKPDEVYSVRKGSKTVYTKTYQFGKSYYYQSYIMGTMWSIPATSENPGRAMKFLNLLHSDKEIHNLLKYGIEGTHYTLNDKGQATSLANSRYNNEAIRWVLGNELIGYPTNLQSTDIFEKVNNINNSTKLSPVIGFMFDRTPVLTEIQACTAVSSKYWNMIGPKNYSETNYNSFIQELEKAGAQKIIDEKQKQLDAWLAKQN